MRGFLVTGLGRFTLATALDASLGMMAGAILAGGFWFFGAVAGAMYGLLAGPAVGLLAAIRCWPVSAIVAACATQFVGALTVGFGMAWVDPGCGPPDHAVAGMAYGGIAGVALAEIVTYIKIASPKQDLEPLCPTCGYSLIGNTSGRCPECGEIHGIHRSEDARSDG